MPLNKDIKKVLVIGSGPIVIGQAAEFDYAGTQACRILKNEGINVVLVNSNPATIMTDNALADEIYLEPLTEETVMRIIEKEKISKLKEQIGLFCRALSSISCTEDEIKKLLINYNFTAKYFISNYTIQAK